MELDDFKNTWDEMSNQVKGKQNINLENINEMNRTKIKSNLKKILLPELLGSIVCIGFAIVIIFHFEKLNSVSFKIAGVITILILIISPAISLFSIHQLYKATDLSKSYAETIKNFALQKIRFCKLQKLNLTLAYLLLVTVIMISPRLFGRKETTDGSLFFIISFGISYILLSLFSKWVFKKYNKTIRQTEDLLKELAS